MPESIAAYLVSAYGVSAGAATFIAYAATTAVAVGYSNQQRRKAERKARNAANASLTDRTLTTRSTIDTRQLVMGKVRTGGTIAFIGSSGADSEKLTLVIALASHRIAGVDAIYFNDELLTLDSNGYVVAGTYFKQRVEVATATMTITSGVGSLVLPYAPIGDVWVSEQMGGDVTPVTALATVAGTTVSVTGFGGGSGVTGTALVSYQYVFSEASAVSRARIRWNLGGADQTAFADLITNFPAQWTSAHRGRGIAYLVCELDFDPDVYPAGIPNISAVVRGADEVYDPRTGLTGYTENPALLLRYYLLHRFGGRRTAAQLDDASFIAAANVCDQSVNYGDGPTALYTAGYVASTDQTPASACDELTEAMAGRWGYSSGQIRVRAGAIGAAVADIDESWLTEGQISVQPARPRAELGNVMQGTFIDPSANWQQVQFPRVPTGDEAAVLLAADGGVELAQDAEFAAINRVGQAQQVAAVLLRETRQGLTVSLDCNMRAYTLQMFDTVSLSLARYGWDAKLFEVIGRTFTLGGAIRLVLRETGSAVYAFGTSFGTTDLLPNTSLPNPWVVPQMGAVTASSGAAVLPDGSVVTRVALTWAAPADAGVLQGGRVDLAYREATVGAELQTIRADSYTGHTLVGLRGGRAYLFQVRAVNGLSVRGEYGPQTLHVVYVARGPKTFRQASAPTNPADDVRDEDRWIDTDDGLHQYLRVAGAWVSVRDATIAAAQSDADAAAAAAAAAQGDANTANSVLADIASDSVLTPDEKPRVIQDYTVILAEQAGIDGQATNYGVTTEKTTYDTAVAALTTYLGTLTSPVAWNNLTGNTTIVGATFRGKFADVYTSRQALLDAINAAAKARLGALATLNTVTTPEIAPGAATFTTSDYTATGSRAVNVTDPSDAFTAYSTTVHTLTWANTTAGSVVVQMEFSGAGYYANVSGATNGNAHFAYEFSVSGGGAALTVDSPDFPRAGTADREFSKALQTSVASGATITVYLKVTGNRGSNPSQNTANWQAASTRLTALIR